MMKQNTKAQSILEYSMLIITIIAALAVMQVYVKRSICGRLREAGNEISEQHYEPGKIESKITTTMTGKTSTIVQPKVFTDAETKKKYQGIATYVVTGPGIEGKPGYDATRASEVTTKQGHEEMSGRTF